jgi:hypothetical protein
MSIWDQDRFPGRSRFALGLYVPYAKLASRAYVPSRRDRVPLMGKRPFDVVFGGSRDDIALTANQSIELRYTVQSDFIATSMMVSATASSAASPGCRIGLKDMSTMPNKGKKLANTLVNNVNFGGSGQKPKFFRKPYKFCAGRTIVVKITNLRSTANNVQVVIAGVFDE